MRRQVYSLLVDNNPGVLSRIAGLFSRRGYSIDSITAGRTADPRFTRITVVTSGDELILEQIEKQLRKLVDVRSIKKLQDEGNFTELMVRQEETKTLPFNFRVQQARNYLRLAFNTAAVQYDISGTALSLIVESLLQEEYKQQIAYMAEQTDSMINEIQEEK